MKVAVALALMSVAVVAAAEERIIEVWNCKAADGKTIEDVHEANAKWVKYMNAHVDGGDIISYVLQPIVGKSNTFMYADSFPSMASWGAAKAHESEELTAIEEELNSVAVCNENTLHNSKAS